MLDRNKLESAIMSIPVEEKFPGAKRVGRGYMMHCPFHDDSTPSMSVSEEGLFYCFGCGVKGDYVSYLMMRSGISFPDAIKEIEKMTGVELLPSNGNGPGNIEKINSLAADFYHDSLDGETILYLSERGINEESIEKFRLGLANGGLRDYLSQKGYSLQDMQKAGLLDSKYRDFFWKRLVIPITSHGKVMGFSGRAFGDGKPKYKNSPENALFKKSSILYGMDKVDKRRAKENGLVLVEGYFDVIALHQAGVDTVALMGTSTLTDEQLVQIRRVTDTVYLCFDNDPPGRKATIENAERLLKNGVRSFVVNITCDPDEYILQGGDFKTVLDSAVLGEIILLKNSNDQKRREIAYMIGSRPYNCSVHVLPFIREKEKKAFSELSARALIESLKDKMQCLLHCSILDNGKEVEVRKAHNHVVVFEEGRFLLSRAVKPGEDMTEIAKKIIKNIYDKEA